MDIRVQLGLLNKVIQVAQVVVKAGAVAVQEPRVEYGQHQVPL
jgi:hypothetical protein